MEEAPINVESGLGLLGQDPRLASTVARSGGEALSAVRSSPPDLILFDLGLPDMDGYTLRRSLRADARTRASPRSS